jgi:peptidyl-prolyl cis-trans isomerase SurA
LIDADAVGAAGKAETMDIAMPRGRVTLRSLKRWLTAAFLLAAGLAAPTQAQAQVVVLANGSPITAYDIEQRSKLIFSSTHKQPTRQEVIQDLIDDRIKIDKAKSYGLIVSDDEVNQAFSTMASRQHITAQQFTQFLARAGIAADTIKARIRAELTWNQLIRGKFASVLQVAESDVAQALRARNDATSIGYIYTLYPVILVVPRGSSEGVKVAKHKEAESLRGRFLNCKEGLEFARALRDVAVREPVTRSSADLAPQLRDLLASLPLGRLTPPETTAQGLQMFAICDKKASKTESPIQHEVKDEIFRQRFDREAKRYLDELRKTAMIEYKDINYAKDEKPAKIKKRK